MGLFILCIGLFMCLFMYSFMCCAYILGLIHELRCRIQFYTTLSSIQTRYSHRLDIPIFSPQPQRYRYNKSLLLVHVADIPSSRWRHCRLLTYICRKCNRPIAATPNFFWILRFPRSYMCNNR